MSNDTNFNRGTHGDSSFKLDGLPSSSEKPLPLGMGYVTAYLEDPAPLPMRDEEDTDLRAVYPADPEPAEDENWTK